jgi:monovalent cation/hydrogen antiporter
VEEVEIVLLLLALVAALTVLARRVSVPYPILMTIGGLVMSLVLSLVPNAPQVSLSSSSFCHPSSSPPRTSPPRTT